MHLLHVNSTELLMELSRLIEKSGFAPRHHVIEVHGLCASCDPEQVTL